MRNAYYGNPMNISRILLFSLFLLLLSDSFAQIPSADNTDWQAKVQRVAAQNKLASSSEPAQDTPEQVQPQGSAPANKGSSTLSLIRPASEAENTAAAAKQPAVKKNDAATQAKTPTDAQNMAVKPSQAEPQTHPAKTQTKPAETPKSDVDWIASQSGNFNIKIERRTSGITTPNLAMKFETIYQVLRKNISWMMGGPKTDILVYQSRESFLKNEPVASNWSGAFFSPSENRMVLYDEPNNTDRMISQFSHELTHYFVENFFNPYGKPHRLEPPIWLNEGIAVNMEDIALNIRGGVWASDLVVINIFSSGDKKMLTQMKQNGESVSLKGQNIVSTKVVFFKNFADFLKRESYDAADQQGDMENWYFQAYAMVRFLFKPYNATYPAKRMQFEQFTKLLNTYAQQYDDKGKPLKDSAGKYIMKRTSVEAALRQAYGFKNVQDFEVKFWQWLKKLQKEEREKIVRRGA